MSQERLHPDLPIFAVQDGKTRAVYVPGHVMPATARLLEELRWAWKPATPGAAVRAAPAAAADLLRTAAAVQNDWRQLHTEPFRPLCLNVQFPYSCNLACAYCYTRPAFAATDAQARLNRDAVAAAAERIAGHCAVQKHPFQLVIQGLGEPTQAWDDLQWCVAASRAAAAAAGVAWVGHLATNGQLDEAQAHWVGGAFTHVTVSCDGPPDIQDTVRPRRDGASASARLPGRVAAIAARGAVLEARVTLTGANATRLDDVIRFVVEKLAIRSIRLEPVFAPGTPSAPLPAPDVLVRHCLAACDAGAGLGAEVCLASPDLTRLHGEYCEASRQTLRLMPDGAAVNCLLGADAGHDRAVALGNYDRTARRYCLDEAAIARARSAGAAVPAGCADCVNIYHCVRSCPEACPGALREEHYRCRFQRRLAEAWILRAAGTASWDTRPGAGSDADRQLQEEVAALPEALDREAILAQARRARRHYALDQHSMPSPVWGHAGQGGVGKESEELLLAESRDRTGAISVYVHIPFCRRRCVFCDCHSVVEGRDRAKRYAEYIEHLTRDLAIWRTRGGVGDRPVTTVHFGGGTPDTIGYPLLEELVAVIRRGLATSPATEWAIETTVDGAAPDGLDRLLALGFRRLHVGAQTLDDGLRRRLGRKNKSAIAIDRLRSAMAKGLVTSVDMIYGLPSQDAGSLIADLIRLSDIGIHGISLYRLNLSSQNQALLRLFPGFRHRPLRECVLLQAAEQMLLRAGYQKNHFVHYALPEDTNLYFRHAVRGEDLLALGASASGSVGLWAYRCDRYAGYRQRAVGALPLAAMAKDPLPPAWLGLSAGLMAGWVSVESVPRGAVSLISDRWLEAGLLVSEPGGYRLTATGAWLLADMLHELRNCAGYPDSGEEGKGSANSRTVGRNDASMLR